MKVNAITIGFRQRRRKRGLNWVAFWVPSDISNLSYFMDYTDYSTMVDDGGGLISQITDKVTALVGTSAGAERPTYETDKLNGMAALAFAGGQLITHAAFDFTKDHTMFIVGNLAQSSNLVYGDAVSASYFGAIGAEYLNNNLQGTASGSWVRRWGWNYLSWRKGTEYEFFERKNQRMTQYDVADAKKVIISTIGQYNAGFKLTGNICMQFAYSRVLTDAELTKVHSWLEYKTALASDAITTENRISFVGNSMTAFDSGANTYPPILVSQLSPKVIDWVEVAAGGWTMTNIDTAALNAFFTRMHLNIPRSKNDILILWEGTNTLAAGTSAADTYTAIANYCTARKAEGYKIGIGTILPRSNTGLVAGFEAARIAVNADIRTNIATIGTFLIDVGGDALMGQPGDSDNATYYADKIHPTLVGMTRLVTEWFTPAILANWTV